MVPDGYVGVVVADTRRALQWEAGLRAAGFDVARVETMGPDADKGSWQIAVARADALRAKQLVSDVICGRSRLPARPLLSRSGWIALVVIVAVIVLGTVVAVATRP